MRRLPGKMLATASGLLGVTLLAAQSPEPTVPSLHHAAHHKAHPASTHPVAPQQAPVVPTAPPPPNWPVNDTASPASVTWNDHALHIDATNSSLQQILAQVATDTGAKVEGLGLDQRVFGNYGPGDARDVLTQLLLGSGYNIVMVGDNGQGVPRQIMLSARRGANTPIPLAAHANPQDDDNDDTPDNQVDVQPEPVPQPVPAPAAQVPGAIAPPRTPQQLMEEMQQRQQQIQQNQQSNPQ
jgi:hypothetical protein